LAPERSALLSPKVGIFALCATAAPTDADSIFSLFIHNIYTSDENYRGGNSVYYIRHAHAHKFRVDLLLFKAAANCGSGTKAKQRICMEMGMHPSDKFAPYSREMAASFKMNE
jgi:hypothetical protein